MMTVLEISECFPNNFKPVTGEFILQHARALSGFCKVVTVVPLRIIPPAELFTFNPLKLIKNFYKWISGILSTKDFSENNLVVIYLKYFSLPRPFLKSPDDDFAGNVIYPRLKKTAEYYKTSIVYCHWIKPWGKISEKLSRELNIPFIIDHHEDMPTLKKLNPQNYDNTLKLFEKADKIIVHSSTNKYELEIENLNLKEIDIIYLGQNFKADDKEKKFNDNELKLICVSHLHEPRKNIDVLIKAFEKHNNAGNVKSELTICGDGSLKQKYTELAESLSVNRNVKFTGMKTQSEIEMLLDNSDIFILPSFPEAFGIVFIEALAKGLPVITCKGNGGGEELLKLGYPAILTEPGSAEELSEAIRKLYENKNRMISMSETGKEIVRKFFTWDKNAESTYNSLSKTVIEFKKRQQCAE